ncbi:MAG: hypothetical protein ACFB2W_08605 [Leptolyngbyaceae cyanobacterium]
MARLLARIRSTSIKLSLVGGALLLGAASPGQPGIAINQTDVLPQFEEELQTLTDGLEESERTLDQSPTVRQRRQFLLIQAAFAAAVGVSAVALAYGVQSYRKQQQWQRIEFLRRATREFENDPGISHALSILDFEEYRDYPLHTPPDLNLKKTTFKATSDLLTRALSSSKARKYRKQQLLDEPTDAATVNTEDYYAETSLRDWFNQMLNGLEHFGYLVDSQVFTVKEVQPWLNYWVRLIADETYRRNCDSRVYEQLYNYIYDHGFDGVRLLFEKFGYRILRSPYKEYDFVKLGELRAYKTKLALSLAKASRLVYQDIRYIVKISRLWKIDIRNNFRFFNAHNRDTQALIFRTDECMVLAFRGTQEVRDWTTNLNMRLRNFTIRRAGKTTLSSYKGKVHTGFFLGWAEIERDVLDQLERWRTTDLKNGISRPLPPLLITGHSLGGALATMAAAALHENGVDVAGLYTFGQPRVGDLTFSRQLNANLSGKVFRFVNNNDIVPHVPPPFSLQNPFRLYGHLGAVKYFDSKGLLMANYKAVNRALDSFFSLTKGIFKSGLDLISDHNMSYYIDYLDRAMQAEIKNKTATMLELDLTRVGGAESLRAKQKKSQSR